MNKFKEVFCEIFMFLREAGLKKKTKPSPKPICITLSAELLDKL